MVRHTVLQIPCCDFRQRGKNDKCHKRNRDRKGGYGKHLRCGGYLLEQAAQQHGIDPAVFPLPAPAYQRKHEQHRMVKRKYSDDRRHDYHCLIKVADLRRNIPRINPIHAGKIVKRHGIDPEAEQRHDKGKHILPLPHSLPLARFLLIEQVYQLKPADPARVEGPDQHKCSPKEKTGHEHGVRIQPQPE